VSLDKLLSKILEWFFSENCSAENGIHKIDSSFLRPLFAGWQKVFGGRKKRTEPAPDSAQDQLTRGPTESEGGAKEDPAEAPRTMRVRV
jgi:hypothetical protein